MTPKEKQRYFRQTFDYWMEWMTEPDDQRSPMERIGCYVNIYSMFEYRIKCLVIEDGYENQNYFIFVGKSTDSVGANSAGYRTMNLKEYTDYKNGSYDIQGSLTMASVLGNVNNHNIISSANENKIKDAVDFRNTVIHKTMFKHKEITDEKIEDIIHCFRLVDARLKSLRRTWARMAKIKLERAKNE